MAAVADGRVGRERREVGEQRVDVSLQRGGRRRRARRLRLQVERGVAHALGVLLERRRDVERLRDELGQLVQIEADRAQQVGQRDEPEQLGADAFEELPGVEVGRAAHRLVDVARDRSGEPRQCL